MKIDQFLSRHSSFRRGLFFIAVGAAAAAVHWVVAVALIRFAGLAPLIANLMAWLTAFFISSVGHRHLTFGDRTVVRAHSRSLFLLISISSLALNEVSLWILLRGRLDYRIALVVAMLIAAVFTYVMSNRWAFRSNAEVVA